MIEIVADVRRVRTHTELMSGFFYSFGREIVAILHYQ